MVIVGKCIGQIADTVSFLIPVKRTPTGNFLGIGVITSRRKRKNSSRGMRR